jgi:hypothetical protein
MLLRYLKRLRKACRETLDCFIVLATRARLDVIMGID